jgi:hypothetical protein
MQTDDEQLHRACVDIIKEKTSAGLELLQKDDWKFLYESEDVEVYQRPVTGSPLVMFRGKQVMNNVKWIDFLNLYEDMRMETLAKVDPDVIEISCPKKFSELFYFYHTVVRAPVVTDREFLLVRDVVDDGDAHMIVGASVPAELTDSWCPKKKGTVRGLVNHMFWHCLQQGDDLVVNYLLHGDPCGWIPAWLYNRFSSDQAMNPNRYRTELCKLN